MLWKRKCMFKGEKLGQGKIKAQRLFFAVRQRGRGKARQKEREKEREAADYTLVTPCFVPFTFGIIREVLLDQHSCYRAPLSSSWFRSFYKQIGLILANLSSWCLNYTYRCTCTKKNHINPVVLVILVRKHIRLHTFIYMKLHVLYLCTSFQSLHYPTQTKGTQIRISDWIFFRFLANLWPKRKLLKYWFVSRDSWVVHFSSSRTTFMPPLSRDWIPIELSLFSPSSPTLSTIYTHTFKISE